jgi:hypothetical protein
VFGLLWLWVRRSLRDPRHDQLAVESQVVLSFFVGTADAGGIGMLMVDAEDTGRLLWFVGQPIDIERMKSRLGELAVTEWVGNLDGVSRLWWLNIGP